MRVEPDRRRLWPVLLGLLLVPLAISCISFLMRAPAAASEPYLARPELAKRCVMDRATMRYQHMDFLKGQRDRVVREGSRAALGDHGEFGFSACFGCHTDRSRFCDQCHSAAEVRIDCFDCHRDAGGQRR